MLAIFPEMTQLASKGLTEELAIVVRKYFAGEKSTSPKLDLFQIIGNMGIPLIKLPMDEYAMIAVRDEQGRFHCSIALSDKIRPDQQSFILAHCLGHYLFNIQPKIAKSEWSASGYKELVNPYDRYVNHLIHPASTAQEHSLENTADRFSAALLMPKAMMMRAREKNIATSKVAILFGVTEALVMRRYEDLLEQGSGLDSITLQDKQAAGATASADLMMVSKSGTSTASTDIMLREKHHKATKPPKQVAAKTYAGSQDSADAVLSQISGKGMERLRQIAKLLDKTGK